MPDSNAALHGHSEHTPTPENVAIAARKADEYMADLKATFGDDSYVEVLEAALRERMRVNVGLLHENAELRRRAS